MFLKLFPFTFLLILLGGLQQIQSQNYTLNGDAIETSEDCYQLTDGLEFQNGTVWYNDQLNLEESFDIELVVNLGVLDANGADGIVFVLQTVGTDAIGLSGGGIGFEGFEPSFGIEFDTWQNADFGDPVEDHIAIVSNGNVNHMTANTLSGPTPILPGGANIEDGLDHIVRIEWNATTQNIDVYIDCELTISLSDFDLINEIFLGDPNVWFGFTGATGGSVNVQTVCLSENILEVSTDQSICAGESVQLLAGGSSDGTYIWSPADGLSATDIPNPIATPTETTDYIVTFNNLCGFVISDTINVLVESCFECDPEAGIVESESPLCVGDQALAFGSNFNEDALYNQAFVLVQDNIILDIEESGIFGVLVPGEYEVYPLNYAIDAAPDLELFALDLSSLTQQTACFDLGDPIPLIIEICIECEANAGTVEAIDPNCDGGEINASSNGFNEDALYGQTLVLVQDDEIVAIEESGEFGAQESGDYEVYPLNYLIDDGPDLDLIGEDLEDLSEQTACFDLGEPSSAVILEPIEIDVDYDCNELTGTYSLTFSFEGGLPAYDATSPYMTSGALTGSYLTVDNNHTLIFLDATPYQLNIVDEAGCTASISDQPDPCIKTAIELLSFEGTSLEEGNLLTWETASETDGDFFVLEKSFDGFQFEAIATVDAQESNVIRTHEFLDQHNITGKNFYRLRFFNAYNSITHFSNIVLLERKVQDSFDIKFWNFEKDLNIFVESNQITTLEMELITMEGKIVYSTSQSVTVGENPIELAAGQLPSGLYLLRIKNEGQQLIERVLKP